MNHGLDDNRRDLDEQHSAKVGDVNEGFWGKAAPSSETLSRFLAVDPVAAASACPGLKIKARELGVQMGRIAEWRASKKGATLLLQAPVLNRRGDEALLSVSIVYPGGRDATGWVYLLRKQTDGAWTFVDRLFVYVS